MSGLKVFQTGEVITAEDLNYNFEYLNRLQQSLSEHNFNNPLSGNEIGIGRLANSFQEITICSPMFDATSFDFTNNRIEFGVWPAIETAAGGNIDVHVIGVGIYGDANMAGGPTATETAEFKIEFYTLAGAADLVTGVANIALPRQANNWVEQDGNFIWDGDESFRPNSSNPLFCRATVTSAPSAAYTAGQMFIALKCKYFFTDQK